MIRVIITDDHPIVREGIKQILGNYPDIKVVDEVERGGELISKVLQNQYDVVLLDISLPDRSGLDVLQELKAIRPKLPVLILSIFSEDQYAERSLRSGASAYLSKASIPQKLVDVIRLVAQGETYLSPELALKLAKQKIHFNEKPKLEMLSNRELEILILLAEGHAQKDIAKKLSLSPKTISTYQSRILKKLGLQSKSEIIRFAINQKLIT